MRDRFMRILESQWENLLAFLPGLLLAALVMLLTVMVGRRIRRLTQKRLSLRLDDPLLARFLSQAASWLVILLGISIAMHFLKLGGIARGILAGAGLSGIVLGFAFRDIGENLLSGVLLAFNRPFRVGDTIESEGIQGIIKALDLRSTHVRSFDGKDIFIPNAMILKNPLSNFTRDGLLRFEYSVGIDYYDDVEAAMRVMMDVLKTSEGVLKDPMPQVFAGKLDKNTINITAWYWVNLFEYKGSVFLLKSRLMDLTKQGLLGGGFNFTSDIVELKIYRADQPVPVHVSMESAAAAETSGD